VEHEPEKRAITVASLSLLLFSALTSLALIAWFHRNVGAAWGWKSVLTVACAVLGVTTSALLWRAPSRANAIAGIVVMVASLLRIGPPSAWTWVSFSLVAITTLLLIPLVHAALVLRG
jgi:hypothetical protein